MSNASPKQPTERVPQREPLSTNPSSETANRSHNHCCVGRIASATKKPSETRTTTTSTPAIRRGDHSPQDEYATGVMLSITGNIVKHLDDES
jgi:hypothetical protein